jgi:hypothetical protein
MAKALRSDRYCRDASLSRATGKPRKMVRPAKPPRITVCKYVTITPDNPKFLQMTIICSNWKG